MAAKRGSSKKSSVAANRARFARAVKNPKSKLGKKARDSSSNGSPGGGRKKPAAKKAAARRSSGRKR